MSLKSLLVGVALAALSTSAAQALTWTSLLEYKDGLAGAQSPPYGTVTIDEVDANTLHIKVELTNPNSRFVNTGGPHDPFVFNGLNDYQVLNITSGNAGNPDASFYDAGHGSYMISGFGQPSVPFTDKIGLHVYHPAVPCVPKPQGGCRNGTGTAAFYDEPNGKPGGQTGPLEFDLFNAGGLTFAGTGLTLGNGFVETGTPGIVKFDGNFGGGEHLQSTSLGWWFAADIWDADANNGAGATYNVAAKDATTTYEVPPPPPGVPEPASWALMIIGFGAAGTMLRRSRNVLA